jgi:hypothetical protein
MVSLAIEEMISPNVERLATGTMSTGTGVDGEMEIMANHELEVDRMEALVLTMMRHAKEGFTCVSVHNRWEILAKTFRARVRCSRKEGFEFSFLVSMN